MINIFEFKDYRTLIQSYYQDQKGKNSALTLSSVARLFDLSAASLTMILQGKRNLSLKHVHRIADLLKLTPDERDYFECLVLQDEADDESAKAHYKRRMQKSLQEQKTKALRTADRFLLSRWYLPAMLVYLLDHVNISSVDDVLQARKSLKERFGASDEDLEKIIDFVKTSKIHQDDEPTNMHVVFQRLASQIPEKKFMTEVMEETLKRLDQSYGSEDSFYTTAAISITEDQIRSLRHDYKKLIEKYIALGNSASDHEKRKIIQISCQFFSVS